MKTFFYFLSIVFLTLFLSCNSNKNRIQISGELEECIESEISLYLVTPDGETLLENSTIKDGKFEIKTDPISEKDLVNFPAFYKISLGKNNLILTVASPGEKIYIKANAKSLVKTYTVSGGKDAILMYQLDHQLKLFVDSTESLQKIYEINQYNDSVKTIIEAQYAKYVENHQRFLKDFIKTNSNSLTSLTAFYQKFNRRIFLPENENIPLLKDLITQLEKGYPKNPNVVFMKERMNTILKK